MTGHIEPLASVLRIGGAYGEPYTWGGVLRHLSPTSVEVMGVQRAPTRAEWRAAVAVFAAAGIQRFRFVRQPGGRAHSYLVRQCARTP